jgi:HEAT repeat protein
MRNVATALESENPVMYMMPRSFPQSKKWFANLSLIALFMLVFLTTIDVSAQGRRRHPATSTPKTQQQGANGAPTQKPQAKKITPLRSSETADGSRITIRADAPLNDYSAYRSGDRYYVVIPEASAPAAQGGMRGRGFEDVQVQKRGADTVLSFKLQPGTNARVSQKFDKLDVELTTPGRGGANTAPTTGKNTAPSTTEPATQPTTRPTPQTPVNSQTTTANGITGQKVYPPQTVSPGANNPFINQPPTNSNPTVLYPPTPEAVASPSVSPEVTPAASPATEEIAQAQPQPATEPITTSAPATSSASLGVVLQRNWLIILIGALVLASLVMIVAARSKAQRTPTPVRRRTRREKRRAASEKEAAELPEADTTSAVTAASSATPVASAMPEVDVEAVATGLVAAEALRAEETPVAVEEEETKEIEIAPAVDAERINIEVKNVLAGESYDEAVIGASDAGTRQLVATELLAALAARNVERRERAREVFVKYNYLDEATNNLRTADAPAERSAAARSLGYLKDKSTTPHLIAALEDKAPEVRRASVEALADLRDPSAIEPLNALLERERDRKVPKNLIKGAIEASTVVEEETPTMEAAEAAVPVMGATSTEVASELIASAAPPIVEEVETKKDEEAAERQRAEKEAKQLAEAEAKRKAEEEAARLQAEEEEARLKAEAEAERVRVEVEARQRAEAEAAQKRAEEEAAQLRAEEQARRVEEEARRKAEEEARLRAEEARKQAEETRLAAEAEAQRRAEEEEAQRLAEEETAASMTEVALPFEPEVSAEVGADEASIIPAIDPLIERNDVAANDWLEVDMSETEIVRHASPVSSFPVEEAATHEPISVEPVVAEPVIQELRGIEPSSLSVVEEPAGAQPVTKEIDYAVTEKGIAPSDEFSTVPRAILKRLSSEEPTERAAAVIDLGRVGGDDSFRQINAAFDDPAVEVRSAAARSLFDLNSDRAATFTRALREAPPERRRKIGSALASSGLASEAIGQLMGESREKTYDAFSLLFLMSKAGEVQPLMRAIEEHPNNEVRLAVVKLLALSGQQEILPAFRRLAVRGSLPTEVRSAVMEAIYQISSQAPTPA